MCGRFTVLTDPTKLVKQYGVKQPLAAQSYNVAPSQDVPVVLTIEGERRMRAHRFGLVPSWAKEAKIGHKLINARIETVAEKPAFRSAIKTRRCVIPASGFYEWQDDTRQPYYFSGEGDETLSLGGLWEQAVIDGEEILSFAILTTPPHPVVAGIHGRTPLLLPDAVARWLDGTPIAPDYLAHYADAAQGVALQRWPVSRAVNNPRVNRPELVEPERSPVLEREAT